MNNLHLKKLVFLLSISLNAFSQDGKFSFTIPSSANTSAGVFKSDGTLVRTLWNNERYTSGTYSKIWDGKDDMGKRIESPDGSYQVKVLTNNVNYTWQGTIGNTSDNMTGPTKHRGYYHCMRGLAFGSIYGYFCTGYSEGSPSVAKFNINTPNQKIDIFVSNISTADQSYVATDNINVYWGCADAYSTNNTFVYATKVSDDLETDFSSGTSYTIVSVPNAKTYSKTISKLNQSNSLISGLAVQKTGNYLFVARAGLNQLQVLNKTTGVLIQTLIYTNPRGLSIDASENLWMASGTNTVAKYTINGDGTLTAAILTLSGLLDPLATQVSYDGTLISVADGSTSQQVKFFNSSTGVATNTLGVAGGYTTDATVNDNKFYFNDVNGSGLAQYNKLPFIAFQPDGSFWVGDPGNFRVQHYSAGRTYIDRIMSLGAKYSVFVDKNNIKKVFADFLEFEMDYSVQTLSGSSGWILKKNWGATTPTVSYNGSPRFETTLSNGRTYGFIRNVHDWEVVEFPANGTMRFTGMKLPGLTKILCDDGSLQDYTTAGKTATLRRYPLTGFDISGNPAWSKKGELLAEATLDNTNGNPVESPNGQAFSSTDKVVFYNYKAYANDDGPVYSNGFHLGLMQKGASNSFLFQTEQSTHRNYEGEYPNAGFFDVGNFVNDYAGGSVNIVDRNIITSYHGEFWKNSQTNKFNYYYDNGLAIGQFGTTRPEVSGQAAPGMAGNALTPVVVKDAAGDLYLMHGDESDHAGIHRWKITGLNTIAEQVMTISFPSSFTAQTHNYVDLMAGLPFDATLTNNTAGWTRNPDKNNESSPWVNLWRVNTSRQSYQRLTSNDITVEFLNPAATTNTVNRDLGINNVTKKWKISGEVIFPADNNVNYLVAQQYLEVLDANDKILTSFYVAESGGKTTIYGNKAVMASSTGTTIRNAIRKLLPFEMALVNGIATFTYGNYPAVSTTISDAAANWKTPKALRIRILNNGAAGPAYKQTIGIKDFKFYKDYFDTPAPIQSPIANAGVDITITLPTTSTSLTGSGTDSDGTISGYSWAEISGPLKELLATPNAATTLVNNLIPGIYQYELTVTDNKGAIGKDTVQLTVNAVTANNLLPAVNPANTVNGLDYKYYEGDWSFLPAFSSLNPVKTGTATNFDLSPANRPNQYGFSFTGFINVPSDGQYTFYTSSDDGSNLYIDNVLTVANDGLHASSEKSGAIGLKAGKHAITGLFFQQGGGQVFLVSYEGMGISKQAIPASALYRVASGVPPPPIGNLLPAVNPANTVNGLDYKYYEGDWSLLPAFSSLNPVKTGTATNFDLSPANRTNQYGFSFTGFINVPSDGQYTFYTSSDDGSNLYIDNVLAVANDGLHGATEKSGSIGLKAGKHAITGLFFQQGGGQVFLVSYEGMGIPKQAIPASALYRVASDEPPPISNLLPAVNPANTVNGLDYKYYEGDWSLLPAFSSLNPVKTGTATNFDLSPANRPNQYGFSFTGFINVPSDGQYTFYTSSDDGSNLYIDNVLTVANDGLHGTTEKSGSIGLKAGKHAITGLFFQQGGGQVFLVSYEGMGISKQAIPASVLYRVATDAPPPINNLLPAVNPSNTVNGLDYKYYEGDWSLLPAFSSLNPVKTGTATNFNLSPANRSTQYGFSFTGFIEVPSDGQYTFYTSSDDGSNLYIDNVLTVANDGLHGATEKSGVIGLKAGKHAITGLFFQQGGGQLFLVSYEGMGISKQAIPTSALYRVISNDNLRVTVNSTSVILQQPPFKPFINNITNPKFSNSNGLLVYPNPAKDIANLSITASSKNDKLSISVYNSTGMLVNFRQLATTRVNTLYKLNMAGLSSGIYSIIVRFDDGQKISYKLVRDGQ